MGGEDWREKKIPNWQMFGNLEMKYWKGKNKQEMLNMKLNKKVL